MAKILIVDDKESNLFALENVLRRLDVQVVKASSGDDALRATLYHDFALAILDVQMPGMDGYELANLLRSDNRTTGIPIIFLSAVYSEDPYVFRGYESGGVDFITKPFNADVLLSKVRIFLELNEQKERLVQKKAALETLVSRLEEEVEARAQTEEALQQAYGKLNGINRLRREAILCDSEEGVAKTCLAVAEELTGSKFGFIGEIDEKGLFYDIALSDPGWSACRMPRSDAVRLIHDMEIRGIWGRVLLDAKPLIVNDPLTHPDRAGIPEGHPPIRSFMGVPLKDAGRAFGMIALANKEGGYDQSDVQAVESLAVAFVEALQRKRMEEELRSARAELELRVRRRTEELARANEALSKSEEKYRELIESASSVIVRMDAQGHITFINEFGRKLLGCDERGLPGCDPVGAIVAGTKGSEQQLSAFIEEITRHPGACVEHESRIVRKDGEAVWVSWTSKAILDEYGAATGILGIGTEITARKRAEELLRRADRAFRTLSECNQALVREREEQGLLHRICRTIVEVGGYRMAWVGFAEFDAERSVRPVAHAGYDEGYLSLAGITWADSERGKGPTGSAVRTGSIHIARDLSTHPDFTPWRAGALERGFASSIALPLTAEGRPFGALSIYAPESDAFDEKEVQFLDSLAENLSYGIASIRTGIERRRAEEELRSHTAKVELINQELQEFAFIASHDLQEPLRKIQVFADRLKNVYTDVLGEAGNDYLTRMENAANRMQHLIRDLLKYSRVATKPDTLSDVDLNDIAEEVVQIFDASLSQSGGRVEIARLPVVRADEAQMKQLFQNLIGNALKFQREGVTPFVRIYTSVNGYGRRIIFEDNGIGFEEKYLDRIFAPFQRLHSQKEYQGTGMGLALCRKIVERHGGAIAAQSIPGVGSTFIVTLPAGGSAEALP